jgi:UDP-3-O-[3-hydroxymyristoyl] glucosamine N-acyltransferase
MALTLTEIVALVQPHSSGEKLPDEFHPSEQTTLAGDPGWATRTVSRVSEAAGAGPDAIVFAQDDAALRVALASAAGAILAKKSEAGIEDARSDSRVLWVEDPKYAFAVCARALMQNDGEPLRHPTAVVHATARLGEHVRLGAHAVIEAHVVLGDDVSIGSCTTICRGATLGSRVVVQAGAVLGATGFGYVRNADTGEYLLFPQQGSLVIEDDVEIGANTTIDRGALGETRIGKGTKIDNQVHIAHNCRIGKNVVIAAQVGISGSCIVGDGVVMAGQVGLGDHVTIGPGVILGGASGVFPNKTLEGPGQMFMGVPAEPLKDYLKNVAKVRRLK